MGFFGGGGTAANPNTAIGPGTSTAGDVVSFTNTDGKTLLDSGIVAANVTTSTTGAHANGSGVAYFDGATGTKTLTSSGTSINDLVTLNGVQTIASKTFYDDTKFLDSNLNKKIQFDMSGVTVDATRLITWPDANITVVGLATAQTLTNKTIDADDNTISDIADGNIKAAAAIAVNKLAALTASRAVVSDGSGFVSAATTTATEIGYVNGVTSAIQTQINSINTNTKIFRVFNAYDNEPPASNPATPDVRNSRPILRFDTTTQETAIFSDVMPLAYLGGNLIVEIDWSADTATSSNVAWDVTFERIVRGTDDTDSDGWATAQAIAAVTVPGTAGVVTRATVTCTAGSTGTDSIAAGDEYRVRIRRDVANDAAAGDACLHKVIVREA